VRLRLAAVPTLIGCAVLAVGVASASANPPAPKHSVSHKYSVSAAKQPANGRGVTRLADGSPSSGASINVAQLPDSQTFTGDTFNYPSVPLSPADIAPGKVLFVENCSSCHGINADGATGLAPPLRGVGPATIDFWISTGRMPLEQSTIQPNVHPDRFTPAQTRQIVAYVSSLNPGQGPPIPYVNTKAGNLAAGANIFAVNCAGCHVITGVGDALADSTFAPSLALANPTQIGEAVRSGPGNMPIFNTKQISPSQLDSLARYVTYLTKRPNDAGGAGLGHVGPVAEGFVALFLGVGLLMLVAYWIGDRTPDPREYEDSSGHGGASGESEEDSDNLETVGVH